MRRIVDASEVPEGVVCRVEAEVTEAVESRNHAISMLRLA